MEVMRRQRRVHNCLSGTVKFQERTKKHILVVQRAAQEGVGRISRAYVMRAVSCWLLRSGSCIKTPPLRRSFLLAVARALSKCSVA